MEKRHLALRTGAGSPSSLSQADKCNMRATVLRKTMWGILSVVAVPFAVMAIRHAENMSPASASASPRVLPHMAQHPAAAATPLADDEGAVAGVQESIDPSGAH